MEFKYTRDTRRTYAYILSARIGKIEHLGGEKKNEKILSNRT